MRFDQLDFKNFQSRSNFLEDLDNNQDNFNKFVEEARYLEVKSTNSKKTEFEKFLKSIDEAIYLEKDQETVNVLKQFRDQVVNKMCVFLLTAVCPISSESRRNGIHDFLSILRVNDNPKTACYSLIILSQWLSKLDMEQRTKLLLMQDTDANANATSAFRKVFCFWNKFYDKNDPYNQEILINLWENLLNPIAEARRDLTLNDSERRVFLAELRVLPLDIVYLLMKHSTSFFQCIFIDKYTQILGDSSIIETSVFEADYLDTLVNLVKSKDKNHIYQWEDWVDIAIKIVNNVKEKTGNNINNMTAEEINSHKVLRPLLLEYMLCFKLFSKNSCKYHKALDPLFGLIGDDAIYAFYLGYLGVSPNLLIERMGLPILPILMSFLGKNPNCFFKQLESYSLKNYKTIIDALKTYAVNPWRMSRPAEQSKFTDSHMCQVFEGINSQVGKDIINSTWSRFNLKEGSVVDVSGLRREFGSVVVHHGIILNICNALRSNRLNPEIFIEKLDLYLREIYPDATMNQKVILMTCVGDSLFNSRKLLNRIAQNATLCTQLAEALLSVNVNVFCSGRIENFLLLENGRACFPCQGSHYTILEWSSLEGFNTLRTTSFNRHNRGPFAHALIDAEVKYRQSKKSIEVLEQTAVFYLNRQHATYLGFFSCRESQSSLDVKKRIPALLASDSPLMRSHDTPAAVTSEVKESKNDKTLNL